MSEINNKTLKIQSRIENFVGTDESKHILRNLIINKDTISNIGLPVYILSGKTGSGSTTFAKILADIVEKYKLLSKISENNFIEIEYPNTDFKEDYNNFFESFRWMAETTNIFYGVALVDISNYERNLDNNHFLELLQFIKKNKNNIVFMLRIETLDEEEINEIQSTIEKYSYTEVIKLPYLKTEEYLKYIIKQCNKDNIVFECETSKLFDTLYPYIEEAKNAKYFSGLHTINTFISFLAYNQMQNKNDEGKIVIKEKNLKDLLEEFFSKMSVNYKKIGF